MFDRLKAWLTEPPARFADGRDALQSAVAALLIEAATVDAKFDERERNAIRDLLARRFQLTPEAARDLEAAAEQRAAQSAQLFGFLRVVNERLSRERRLELIEMLWEVAYADGVLDPLEDMLLRRLGALIDVSDRERGEARYRVLKRLGIPPPD